MVDLIAKKRDGNALDKEEIAFVLEGYMEGRIPDYQVAALLMAIFFRGMTRCETADLTLLMAQSGDTVDLSSIPGVKVDKHSTGGVGDKTTLIVAPIVASLGIPVAKMSGRGLGHTGGTVDKLEAIPGYRTSLDKQDFLQIVQSVGLSVVGQSGNLAPADKMLYALRDVTATVESIPLIASSIMSKKIAAGADAIVLDVKVGSGAFLKSIEEARELSRTMVEIGEQVGRNVIALITNMDIPLGHYIGNGLEVYEAVKTLQGNGPEDLTQLCVELAANMVFLAGQGTLETCRERVQCTIQNGAALRKLMEMVEAHSGDITFLKEPALLQNADCHKIIKAERGGAITGMNSQQIGHASMLLGAGRKDKDSSIDLSAGIELYKKTGEYVDIGEPIACLYASDVCLFPAAEAALKSAIVFEGEAPMATAMILDRICNTVPFNQ